MEWRDICLHSSRCTGANNEEESNWNFICIMCWTAMRFVYFGFSRCYIVGMWTDVQLWEKWMLSATDNLSSFVEIHSKVGDRRPCCGRLRSLLWSSQIHSDPPLQWSSQIHSPWSSSSSYWSLITLWCGQLKLGMMAMHQIRIGAYMREYVYYPHHSAFPASAWPSRVPMHSC